jgi:hypothetical protein
MLSSLLILSFIYASDLTCSIGKITQRTFGKVYSESKEICYNQDKNILVSRNCENKRCMAYSSKQRFSFNDLFNEKGKPGFVLCRKLGGDPQLIDFYVNNKPYALDRCTFSDGGFVDTGHLLRHFLD